MVELYTESNDILSKVLIQTKDRLSVQKIIDLFRNGNQIKSSGVINLWILCLFHFPIIPNLLQPVVRN